MQDEAKVDVTVKEIAMLHFWVAVIVDKLLPTGEFSQKSYVFLTGIG